jgi:UTP pyrophosphatase
MKYLAAYSDDIRKQMLQLIRQNRLGEMLLQKYPAAHDIRTDKALYDYVSGLKERYVRNAAPLNRVAYDNRIQVLHRALGLNTAISRVQGSKLKANREIHIASLFKGLPLEFLRMIAVHELAHLKEQQHNKAFYQLCMHIEPHYHQYELDLRLYLTHLDQGGNLVWSKPGGVD